MEKVHLGDHVLMMRNGGFGGIHARLLDTLHHSCHEDSVLTPMHRYGGMRKDLRFAVIVYAAK